MNIQNMLTLAKQKKPTLIWLCSMCRGTHRKHGVDQKGKARLIEIQREPNMLLEATLKEREKTEDVS